MEVITTLGFGGRTQEALSLYESALGAKVLFMMRFHECPIPSLSRPGKEDWVFHATFQIGKTILMASDVQSIDEDSGNSLPSTHLSIEPFAGFALAIKAKSVDEAETMFECLSIGGQVQLALAPTAFTTLYGIVKDRFGLFWKVTVD